LVLLFVLWGVIAYIILFPDFSQRLASFLGIGRGVDLIIYVSVLCIVYSLFSISTHLKEVDAKLTRLGRAIALKDAQDTTKKEK